MLLAVIALVGIVAISAIFIGQRQIETEYRKVADDLARQQRDVAGARDDVRDTLLWEKEFLLTRQITAADNFDKAFRSAASVIDRLKAEGNSEQAARLDALTTALQRYAEAFATLVAKDKNLGLDQSQGLEGAMRDAVHSIESQLEAVTDAELRASMLMMRRHEKDFILRRNPDYLTKHAAEVANFTELMKKAFRPGAQRMRAAEALSVYQNAFRLYGEGTLQEAAARDAVNTAYAAVQPILSETIESYQAAEAATLAENERVGQRNITIVIGLIAAAMTIILFSVWLIGRSISAPVLRITAAMRRLADGDTASPAPGATRRDEVGAMAKALEVFRQAAIASAALEAEAATVRRDAEAARIRIQEEAELLARERLLQATGDLGQGLKRMAAGDLSFQLAQPFATDFESLRGDLNATLEQLAGVMADITQSSHSIDNGTREISSGANELAQRTERQAASLEQTAAALEEITANVSSAARRVEDAQRVAREANDSASRGAALVDEAVVAMERIEASSGRIATITATIDQIAFQTNLLALNAGVEAARAGEAGRGFAVVAHEVRELAQRSANAAREIKILIEESASEVEEGVRAVRDTGTALHGISGYVVVMNQHMEAIALSTREQRVGLVEINTAVNGMDQDTQQNAAMVEESNAASAVLAGEATRLRELLSVFRIQADSRIGRQAIRRVA
ncbi:methyl-accepting chemotaxis protein [Rhizobium sp. S152]|uniref:methyl-accepting chemotaxis protein n=1 Tax=Rhizobium sp. S152 TaxID=3055038 RepID=UPI0025AA1F1C|nr:methyl-accepting chemotaxis protein [Rhizobium sp. S152]MDM9626929.1 methyl-accepting chemotaxis protein [Rhizobium sp. S152]